MDNSVSDSELFIQGFTLIRKDRDRNGGGVCLFIKESISFNVRDDLRENGLEAIFVELLFQRSRPLLVGVCYRPPSDGSFLDSFRSAISKVDPRNEMCILGDFNVCTKQAGSSYL